MTELQMIAGGAALDDRPLAAETDWWVREAQSSRGRRALEVYHGETLLDVMVEGALAHEVLRGAVRGEPDEPVLAWGLLTPGGATPQVRFGREGTVVEVQVVAEGFWVALGRAEADRVAVVAGPDAAPERLRVSRPR